MVEDVPRSLAAVIQLTVAPIFFLVGTGSFLASMTSRLGRVVDRARVLEGLIETCASGAVRERHLHELRLLDKRMNHINRAITACTASALMICVTVVGLFVEEISGLAADGLIAGLFIATMLSLIAGLVEFLREIAVAGRSLRVRSDLLGPPPEA